MWETPISIMKQHHLKPPIWTIKVIKILELQTSFIRDHYNLHEGRRYYSTHNTVLARCLVYIVYMWLVTQVNSGEYLNSTRSHNMHTAGLLHACKRWQPHPAYYRHFTFCLRLKGSGADFLVWYHRQPIFLPSHTRPACVGCLTLLFWFLLLINHWRQWKDKYKPSAQRDWWKKEMKVWKKWLHLHFRTELTGNERTLASYLNRHGHMWTVMNTGQWNSPDVVCR